MLATVCCHNIIDLDKQFFNSGTFIFSLKDVVSFSTSLYDPLKIFSLVQYVLLDGFVLQWIGSCKDHYCVSPDSLTKETEVLLDAESVFFSKRQTEINDQQKDVRSWFTQKHTANQFLFHNFWWILQTKNIPPAWRVDQRDLPSVHFTVSLFRPHNVSIRLNFNT